ncbi:DNA-binding transcriptional activator of the SARP family [Amycolatopsis pretoriensis]|uniref:DNA-binding transcriptional activator of the SARP family n=1 Tax=Amycolatopsis pretoriensis TaxID=218821 RepID=A0A1H5RJ42_9PSEU|nr:BTAD domain-containing putative transcriptional regulator [Amycolatopsis pretoriensis]SEF37521.1 DNA-binding transcriptional activator of the SARP family [Amycolatopsis pretoriensis]
MEFLLLGSVDARSGAEHLRLTSQRQRALLAALLMTPNVVVPLQRLVEVVWGEAAPASAMANLRTHVSRLRQQLAALGGGQRIQARAGGYLIETRPDEVDVERFRRIASHGHRAFVAGDDALAAQLLGQALSLWRGQPLSGLPPTPAIDGEAQRLLEARWAVVEDDCRARMNLGACADVAGELRRLVADHPLHERLWSLLMLALAGAGQQAAALDAYSVIRDRLADELGAEPGPDLRDAHSAVLRQRGVPATLPVTPAQLPRAATGFRGRHTELLALDRLLLSGDGPCLVVIAGTAGAGKSELATQWAHRVREKFPDGQLYADLHDTYGPASILARFLRALGVPAQQIPRDVIEATTLYRSVLAVKSVLCLVDNVTDAAEVRPLLPAASSCAVVVTSRNRLDGLVALEGAHRISLDVLPPADAVAVLTAAVGAERSTEEPTAIAELAETCARLPLALRIAGAQIRHRAGRRVTDHLADMRNHGVLNSLTVDGDTSAVRTAYDLSYQALDSATRRTFRLLGLVPGGDITPDAAGALTGAPAAVITRQLERLASAHLVQEHAPNRYRLHDLLRHYAAERAQTEDDSEAATRALLGHYLAYADAAADLLYSPMLRLPGPRSHSDAFADRDTARAWFGSEFPNLVAAIRHAHTRNTPVSVCRLVDALRGYCMNNWSAEGPELARIGLESANATGRPDLCAVAHNHLAASHALRCDFPPAIRHFEAALHLYRALRSRRGMTAVLNNLAMLYLTTGDLERATTAFAEAIALEDAPNPWRQLNLGILHEHRGDLTKAAAIYAQQVADGPQPCALVLLARVGVRVGDYGAARHAAEEAAEQARCINDHSFESRALTVLSTVHAGVGNHAGAVQLAETALESAAGATDPTIEAAGYAALAAGHLAGSQYRLALLNAHHALQLTRRLGTRFEECEALLQLAHIHRAAGTRAEADHYFGAALRIAESHGYRGLADRALG